MSPSGTTSHVPLSSACKAGTTGSVCRPSIPSRPTTFFLRTEEDLEQDITESKAQDHLKSPEDSTYGVRSLEESTAREEDLLKSRSDHGSAIPSATSTAQTSQQEQPAPCIPTTYVPRISSATNLSQPLTPIYFQSPVPGSAQASTPKSSSLRSFQLYDDGDSTADSQCIASSDGGDESEQLEEEIEPPSSYNNPASISTHEAPQFVMPSIAMPSRRPFTETGKQIGKLKILVFGQEGIGKTSLIKSMIQLCEHIVHVDPLPGSSSVASTSQLGSSRPSRRSATVKISNGVEEIHASTRAYPGWWSDLEESRTLRKRRSANEPILERNVRFIEITGATKDDCEYGQSPLVIREVENLLRRSASFAYLSDQEISSMLSGSGGIHVDLVILMLPSGEHIFGHLELMQRLNSLTNVIPVIAKGDLLSEQSIKDIKSSVSDQLKTWQIQPFLPGLSNIKGLTESSSSEDGATASAPFVVSSAATSDDDNMDASLMMSPDYVQPLVPSDLAYLVSRIFEPDTAACLRHLATRKYLHWFRESNPKPAAYLAGYPFLSPPNTTAHTSPLAFSQPTTAISGLTSTTGHVLFPRSPLPSNSCSPAPFSFAAHAAREESLATIRLAKWATNLQRSLANERSRFESLQRSERSLWLNERLNECVEDGEILPVRHDCAHKHSRHSHADSRSGSCPRCSSTSSSMATTVTGIALGNDPLGLLSWERRAFVTVQVLGSCGLVGALAVWAAKSCGWSADLAGVWVHLSSGSWFGSGAE